MKRQRREPIVLSQMRPITLFLVLAGCITLTFAFIHFSDVASFFRRITSISFAHPALGRRMISINGCRL